MKKSLLIAIISSLSLSLFSQQDPQMTFWMFDRQSFNPGAVGMDDCHCGSLFYRNQWTGFERAPKTMLFNYSGLFNLTDKFQAGAGLTFFNDRLGQETNNVFRVHFAPKFDLNGHTLSLGLSLGFLNKSLGNEWIAIDDFRQDDAIPDSEIAQTSFDLGFGAVISKPNKYYVGVSATHLTAPSMDNLNFKSSPHAYIMGGVNFPLGSGPLVMRTNALIKTDLGAPPAYDLNANVLWNDLVFGGLTFRPGDAIAPMAGLEYKFAPKSSNNGRTTTNSNIRLGYTYDITTSELRNYSSGSHEFFVTYCLKMETTPIRIRHNNPRFL